MTTQLIESLSDAQFRTLQQLINDPYGIEALRLAAQIKTLKLAHFGSQSPRLVTSLNHNN